MAARRFCWWMTRRLFETSGKATLTRFGYTVLTAADGDIAVERYGREQERIDLVILDLVMPRMGGKKCLEALIRINPAVKVIIASGYSESEHRADLIKSGAKGFVGKPYAASTASQCDPGSFG